MIKNIIFDLGGVCLSDHWAYTQRLEFSQHFHLDPEKTELYHRKHAEAINRGVLSQEKYFYGLFLDQGGLALVSEAIQYLQDKNQAYDEVLTFIQNLKGKFMLFALTNEIKEAGEYRIKKFELLNYFQSVYVSGSIGFSKPNPLAYLYVLQENNLDPTETIYVDNQENNLVPAKQLGMTTIHFTDFVCMQEILASLGVY